MDGYPTAYVAHNLPLLVVAGLETPESSGSVENGGTKISSELPCVETEEAQALLKHFKDSDGSELAWNSRVHSGRNKFRVKTVGRDYLLPPRSAQLPTSRASSPGPRPVLHSALSPLSPGSPVYPDGLVASKWVEKHQDHVPSAILAFYAFTSDPKLATLHDNKLKSDINGIKLKLSQSGYKTRIMVALLGETSVVQSPEIEDRLSMIRKTTGLDSKTSLFFLPPKSSAVELQAFVETILTTIYPICIEYYRDLSKHTRRKRNRGIVPPPTAPPTSGTSQTLSSQGWNVRYDFKLGVFAEFRQEMDAAVRSYESGYEGLLGPDVLESIATWSPRFNEARLLADIFALRSLRCLLWNGNTTSAVRRWQAHRERMRDFVDRRGKGSTTYAWKAWESRWATIMGEMILKVSLQEFVGTVVFLTPDKSITLGERVEPWEHLHHAGYWFRAASRHLMARRNLALEIPEEDRLPPSASSASQLTSKAYTYDTYLCPEPHDEYPLPGRKGVDHSALIVALLKKGITEFEQRDQKRVVQELQLLAANENMKIEAWEDAVKVLRPLWQKMTYRAEGWWSIVEEIGWALRKAAAKAGDGGSVIAVDWELMQTNFTHHSNWHYDLIKSLIGLDAIKTKPNVVIYEKDVNSFLAATYYFEYAEGKVGEQCSSQFSVTSSALPAAAPVTFSEVQINFEGGMKPILISHKNDPQDYADRQAQTSLTRVDLHEALLGEKHFLTGEADLVFRPGRTRIFEFVASLREAGEAKALSARFSIAAELFDLEYVHAIEDSMTPDIWWGEKSMKKRIVRASPSSITVLPKPPKLQLELPDFQEQYYTNEEIVLLLRITNEEDDETIPYLQAGLVGAEAPAVVLRLPTDIKVSQDDETPTDIEGIPLGRIPAAASIIVEVVIPAMDLSTTYELLLKATYHLVSDLETPVYQTMSTQLEVINPFEANYDFSPRIHPDPWPSLFTHNEGEDSLLDQDVVQAHGLSQKWCLTARYASFASDELIVEDVDIEVVNTNGGIQSSTNKLSTLPEGGLPVAPKSLEEAQFDVFTQKLSLDDRGTATLDVTLSIKWRRSTTDSPLNTSLLPVPRLLVSSSEPRVLASVSYSTNIPSMIHFDVTIENPSNHFLTFGITMEPSEKFAFSGIKQSTLQLVPLSRRTMSFRLLPCVTGEWIGPIMCVIKDRYFQKVLRIAPTEGMRIDKEGILIWVPVEEEL